MRKTWIFFKLRMVQLKSDKTSLFFSYVLPVLLLLGIGYPFQLQGDHKITLFYSDTAQSEASAALVDALGKHELVTLLPAANLQVPVQAALENNDVKHYLDIRAARDATLNLEYHLYTNSLVENRVENTALHGVIDELVGGRPAPQLATHNISTNRYTSYLVTLLPGIIGMTLLIIGLNGFGGVLIEEEHHGLYRNIKTIDVSPVPFLAGLFASRMLVAYSVAVALHAIGVLVFGIPSDVNYLLLGLVITLGCIAFLGMGLVIATLSPSVTAFNGIVNFVQLPFIILGGVFFSISAFPQWLQFIAKLIPLTQLNTAMRELLFESVSFQNIAELYPELAVLAAWSIFTLVFARMQFRW